MTPICVLDPGTCLGSSLEKEKYVSKNCKGFSYCNIPRNKSNLPKTLKQSNKEKRDIPSRPTRDPAQFGHCKAWSTSVTGPDQAVAAPPLRPWGLAEKQQSCTRGHGVRLKSLPLPAASVIKAKASNDTFCLIAVTVVPSPASGW